MISNSQQYDSRLAELIWRSIKLRVTILLICIFALLITWSSLEVGNRKAQDVDKAFCFKTADDVQQIYVEARKLQQPPIRATSTSEAHLSPADYCALVLDTRYWIQYQQLDLSSSLADPKTPEVIRKLQERVWNIFADYDIKRDEAFRLDLKLSSGYSENSIEANALSVAACIPFVVSGLLILYFMLGHQEAAWRSELLLQLKRLGSEVGSSPDLFASKSQHFVSPRDSTGGIRPPSFLYSPDKFATTVLLVSASYLLFRVTGEFASELTNITDSIFWSYPFWLYTMAFSAVLMLIASQRHYAATVPKKWSDQLIIVPDTSTGSHHRSLGLRKIVALIGRPMTVVLVAVGFGSIFFPMAWRDLGGPIYGYEWLLFHDPSDRLIGVAGQAMNLTLFREVRIEIVAALIFLALCLLSSFEVVLPWPRLRRTISKLRFLGAIVVAFLSINYLIFMAILDDEAFNLLLRREDQSQGTMIWYHPGSAYWVFTTVCMVLSALTLGRLDGENR